MATVMNQMHFSLVVLEKTTTNWKLDQTHCLAGGCIIYKLYIIHASCIMFLHTILFEFLIC